MNLNNFRFEVDKDQPSPFAIKGTWQYKPDPGEILPINRGVLETTANILAMAVKR